MKSAGMRKTPRKSSSRKSAATFPGSVASPALGHNILFSNVEVDVNDLLKLSNEEASKIKNVIQRDQAFQRDLHQLRLG